MTPPTDAQCAKHPGVAAVGSCSRCGTFVCADDARRLMQGTFCADCAARPEVAFLDTYRSTHWGKRDSWAWLFGVTGLISAAATVGLLGLVDFAELSVAGPLGWALFTALYAVTAVAFWARVRLARVALAALVGLLGVVLLRALGPPALVSLLLPVWLTVSALTNVRTKLFFRIEVPPAQLERAWRRGYDTPVARQALSYGIGGLFLPVFAPLAVVLGVVGLLRVDPRATPPVGGRAASLAGVVLGVLVMGAWVAVVANGLAP